MSHTVTVTRTTTTTTTSAILLNVGYFKTVPGILKLLHILIGIVVVTLVGHYIAYHKYQFIYTRGPNFRHVPDHGLFIPELFFLLIATTCLISSMLLLISCIVSIATATILPKTVFEIVYHLAATILLLLSAAIYLYFVVNEYNHSTDAYRARLAAGALGIVNSLLYGLAVFFAYRGFRSG